MADFMDQGCEGARPSGWDPVERLKDQDLDGVRAEVLYPTLGMPLFGLNDAELQRACFNVYTDWVAEFCAHAPRRLYGIALISLGNIADGVADLERAAKAGMRGAMIWGSPPEDRPYSDPSYDPFWQAASDVGLPVSLHIIAGRGRISTSVANVIGQGAGGTRACGTCRSSPRSRSRSRPWSSAVS